MTPTLTLQHQKLIKYIDDSVRAQKYGSISITVIIKNGIPISESCKLVKMKRIKYKQPSVDSAKNLL